MITRITYELHELVKTSVFNSYNVRFGIRWLSDRVTK
jgi:hypothetical protein